MSRAVATIKDVDEHGPIIEWHQHWAELKGRTLHLTQPAQAVDVEKVREERDSQQRAAIAAIDRAERAEADLEAANKAVDTYREMLVSIIKVVRERDDRELQAHIDATGITAHLSENSR